MKTAAFLVAILVAGTAAADSGMAVTDINAPELYVYDAEGEEIGKLKAKAVSKEFKKLTIDGKEIEGLSVLDIDQAEGLVSVSLTKYPDAVWIETMAVEIWPGNRLNCPKVAEGKSEVEKSGMTIGFGDHCNPPEE